jgi:hypothetical protein
MADFEIVDDFSVLTGTITICVTGEHVPEGGHMVAVRDPAVTTRAELLAACQRTADEVAANYAARAAAAALAPPAPPPPP